MNTQNKQNNQRRKLGSTQNKDQVINTQYEGIMNGAKNMKFFDVTRGEESKYYLLNINKAVLFNVTKKEMKEREGLVIVLQKKIYKCENGTREQNLNLIKSLSYRGESLPVVGDFVSGLSTIINIISSIGRTKEMVSSQIHKFKERVPAVKQFLMSVASLLISVVKIHSAEKLEITSLLEVCLNMYRSFVDGSSCYHDFVGNNTPTLSILLAMASLALPKNLLEVFKRMSMFTTAKILDDASGFYNIFSNIVEYLEKLVEYLPFKLPELVTSLFDKLVGLRTYKDVYKCEVLYNKWRKDRKIMLEESFRDEVKVVQDYVHSNLGLLEWSKKSKAITSILNNMTKLVKATQAYESSARVEPSCFIFEGPPGVKKSIFMNSLIQVLGHSTYVHSTKSATDGKDFYDAYNNETVFMMDDVGQQGVSQWRHIINMVAPVKLPLECAAVDLKDTKFFTSEILLLTTNSFLSLNGIAKNDGISDLHALWRRGYVFDFSKVFNNNNTLSGRIQFKHYNVIRKGWISGFPEVFNSAVRSFQFESFIDASEDPLKIVAWMKVIVDKFQKIKNEQYENNVLTVSQKELVKDYEKLFVGETLLKSVVSSVPGIALLSIGAAIPTLLEYGINVYQEYYYQKAQQIVDECAEAVSLTSIADSLLGDLTSSLIHNVLPLVVVSSLVFVASRYRKFKNAEQLLSAEAHITIKENAVKVAHPSVLLAHKQTFYFKLNSPEFVSASICLLSGRHIITMYHVSDNENGYLTLYKDKDKVHIVVDQVFVERVYFNVESDISIWKLPDNYPTPFKNLSHLFNNTEHSKESFMIHPEDVVSLSNMRAEPVSVPTPYVVTLTPNKEFTGVITPVDITYKFHYKGLCGAPIVSNTGRYIGMHVAGSDVTDLGVALRLSSKILDDVRVLLEQPYMKVNTEVSDKVIPNFSGIKLKTNISVHTPHKSKLIESPIHEVFPIERFPAELSKYGPHTVKDVAKKSFKPVSDVDVHEIEFGKKVLSALLDDFSDLPLKEIIQGNELLAGINKKSSNGLFSPASKIECIDFELGCLQPEFEKEYNQYEEMVRKGELTPEDIAWSETLKDELRPKDKDPRSFRVSRIHMQILTKKVFGRMVEQVIRERKHNKIMIGVNPYEEWDELYREFSKHLHFAGDIKLWDGSMLSQVQHAMYEVFKTKYKGDPKFLDFIMGCITYCLVVVNDDTYMTTHSMPSGSFITAILNSLINRFYTAMWYYRNMKDKKPTVSDFNRHIIDYVYGDDKLNALTDPKLKDRLNAVTMREFFVSIGMDFTDSKKRIITEPFQSIEDITFLKRSFEYHPLLRSIVGPLDYSTIYSSVSWLDSSKDQEIVMDGKLSAFQRESFLHWDTYWSDLKTMKEKCEEKGVPFDILPIHYLKTLYETKEFNYKDDLYGSF